MTELIASIERCLASLRGEAFTSHFLDLVEAMRIDQIMVFSVSGEGASCLVSRHFQRSLLGQRLAAEYLDGWFREDPLFPELMMIGPDEVVLRRLEDFVHLMSPDYRRKFFDAPKLRGKTALLCAGRSARLTVNLYQNDPASARIDEDVARIIGRLALLHFDGLGQPATPPPLAALSAREREVCLRILSGKKSEIIAGELDVTLSTVVTYRKRAYEKLGIASRAELFAICARSG